MAEYRTDFHVIVEPDNSEPDGYVWEVYMPAPWLPGGRHVIAEGCSRWFWAAKNRALIVAWRLSRTRIEASR